MPRLAAPAFCLALALFPITAAKGERSVDVRHFALENGLQVYLLPRPGEVVAHMLFYRLGAADEEVGKSGLAHFLEHLMFKGLDAEGNPVAGSARIRRLGGRENAFTSWDYVAYYQVVAKEHLEEVMTLEAERMRNLRLDRAQTAAELGVVLEERSLRTDNSPIARLEEAANATLFVNHPYRTPIIGWRREIEKLTLEDALDFHARYYKPQNAFLVISGNLSLNRAKQLARKRYGDIKASAVKPRPRPMEPPHQPPKRVSLTDNAVSLPLWQRTWLIPKQTTPGWQLLEQMLNAPKSGILDQQLVKNGPAATASARYSYYLKDYGKFSLSATPLPEASTAEVERAVETLLAKLPELLSGERLRRAKARLKGELLYQRDGVLGAAYMLGIALASGHALEDILLFEQRLDETDLEDIKALASTLSADRYSVTAVAEKAAKTTESP